MGDVGNVGNVGDVGEVRIWCSCGGRVGWFFENLGIFRECYAIFQNVSDRYRTDAARFSRLTLMFSSMSVGVG